MASNGQHAAQQSPWGGLILWLNGGVVANQAACEALAGAGQITICFNPAEDATIQQLFVVARDINAVAVGAAGGGNLIFSKLVSAD
jgi:hypothetical protein